jgi:hypothetical protein
LLWSVALRKVRRLAVLGGLGGYWRAPGVGRREEARGAFGP